MKTYYVDIVYISSKGEYKVRKYNNISANSPSEATKIAREKVEKFLRGGKIKDTFCAETRIKNER